MNVDTPALVIDELRADDPAAVEAAYEIGRVAMAADVPDFPPPCRFHFEARLHQPWPGQKAVHRLAYLDGQPAGTLELELPELDNRENAELGVTVHPAYRRRGVGRALFARAVELARAEGRKRVMSMSVQTLPGGVVERSVAGTAFATAMGMREALVDVRRRLDVSTVDQAALDRLLAEAWPRATGYSLVHWQNETPEEHIVDIASLDSQFLAEAPMGDLAWEPENVDPDRIRAMDATRAAYRTRMYQTGLRHDGTGRMVAWSALAVRHTVPYHAWQNITLVHPAHRGHRLGIISKVVNLRYLLESEPAIHTVDTWNATVNAHMIAINEAMGFRPVDSWVNWQREI
jgi:GNAT superfamily N-acetyltransferase